MIDMTFRLVLLAALAAVTVAHAADVSQAFKPMSRGDVAALDLAFPDVRQTRAPRQPIDDLMLIVAAADGARTALARPEGIEQGKRRSAFSTRLIIVSRAMLYGEASAACGAWKLDVAVCQLDCDGGEFKLRRLPDDPNRLDLVIGVLPGEDADGAEPGLSLAACGLESGGETRLVPKSGRALVEVPLSGD